MKKVKCYGRVKTRAMDTSKNQAFFDSDANTLKSLGVDPLAKNNPPDPDMSDMVLFSSFTQELPQKKVHKKRNLILRPLKRMSRYLLRNQRFNSSNSSSVSLFSDQSFSKKSILKEKISKKKTVKGSKLIGRSIRYGHQKTKIKCKKVSQCLNETRSTYTKKKLNNKKCATKTKRQKCPRKCKKGNNILKETIALPSSTNEPEWSSIYKHSLNIEKPLKKKEFAQSNIKRTQINLPGSVNLLDNSPVPASLKTGKSGMTSHAVFSQKSTRKEFHSSTPISIRRNSSKGMHLPKVKSKAQVNKINIATSTPTVRNKKLYETLISQFNVSGISNISKKDGWDLSVSVPPKNTTQFPSTPKSCIISSFTSEHVSGKKLDPKGVSATEHNINDVMNKYDLNLPLSKENLLGKSLTYHNVLHKSNLTTSQYQSTRSLEAHPTFDKSVLKDISTKRSFHSLDKVDSLNTSLDCLENNLECDLSKLLEFCQQDSVIGFKDIFDWSCTAIRKIGEGTYGEVFLITQNKISSVIKVIPFTEESTDNSMQTIETVYSEMKVAHCLSELRTDENNQTINFNKLKSAKIVRGFYPNRMLDAWDTFSKAKTSYNSRPDVFDKQQIFAILELEYGGKDMTEFVVRNAAEAECIFKQIVISLAIAEEAHLFEHRDLHLGNILVKRNPSKKISYTLRGKTFFLQNNGLVVSIIDFTLSRVLDSGCVFYNDLANDESLFNQSGDYQFEVYKLTRQHLNNEWQRSVLYSNVLWLSFLCVKILKYKYSRPKSKKHLESMQNILMVQKLLPDCKSALDVFQSLQIMDYIPKRSEIQSSRLSKTTKFFDRKSIQKSNSGI